MEEGSHTHKNISIEPSLLFFTQFLAFLNILSYLCPQNRKVMITTVQPQTKEISTVDALWVLIQSQSKRVRQALTKRLLAEQAQAKAKVSDITQTAGYKEAMDDIKHGRVTEYASLKDFYKEMGL
jgi:hypothetical protein